MGEINSMSFFKIGRKKSIPSSKSSSISYQEFMTLIESFVHQNSNLACAFDNSGELLYVNTKLLDFLYKSDPEGVNFYQTLKQFFRHFNSEIATKMESQTANDVYYDYKGERISIQITHTPINVEGELLGSLCIIVPTDQSEKISVQNEHNALHIFDNLHVAFWSVDPVTNEVLYVSSAAKEIYEINLEDITPNTWKELIHPEDLKDVQERQSKLLSDNKIIHQYRIITPNGNIKWIKDQTIAVLDANGELIQLAGYIEEITTYKELQRKLTDIAYFDELTKLPNRYAGRKYLDEAIFHHQQNNKKFALFFVDIDNIQRFNHSLGFEIGDQIIRATVQRINRFINNQGKLFHIFGDEIGIIIENQTLNEDFSLFAERLIRLFKKPLEINGYNLYISISVGISVFPSNGKTRRELVNNGQIALSRAKQYGKANYQIQDTALSVESFKLIQLENDLLQALEKGELYLEYQPKIEVRTQKAIGAEALIRWKHPVWGMVSPAEFIPLSEGGPIIEDITNFVISEVCKQAAEWSGKGLSFDHVSFNLSPNNFYKHDLADRIQNQLKRYNLSPSLLKIEITEGSLLYDSVIAVSHLKKLNDIGIKIALDDYGTGYSSIQYIKRYPFDSIKIDRSFIEKVAEDGEDTIIVKSIIELAKGLNKKVVAEGVEKRNQFDRLKKLGCDEVQGFLFSKSVEASKMENVFKLDKVKINDNSPNPYSNRRRFYRVEFPFALSTQMTILYYKDKEITLGNTEVLVQDIGLGGLKFMSQLRLSNQNDIVYGFETTILGVSLSFSGKIVWSHEVSQGIFEYGVEFIIEESDRQRLAKILNKLSVKFRSNPMFREGKFISVQPITYIKNKLTQKEAYI